MLYYALIFFRAALFSFVMYYALKLVEEMLDSRRYGTRVRIALCVINSLISTSLVVYFPPITSLFLSFVVFFVEMVIMYHRSKMQILLVLSSLIINVMCAQGISSALISMFAECSLHEITADPVLKIFAVIGADFFELLGALALISAMPMDTLRLAVKNFLRRKYMTFWILACTLFLLAGTVIYEKPYGAQFASLNHLMTCFVLLCSYYVVLTLSSRLNRLIEYEQKNKALSQELVSQKQLQSALTRGALFTTKANLTQNKILQGLEVYAEQLDDIHNEYDCWFDAVELRIHPDDHKIFGEKLDRQKLLDCFQRGTEPTPFEYRRMDNDGRFHWTKLNLRLFSDLETNDVYVFGYAFNVDKEYNEKLELEFRAHTDSLTKLLNRDTAENLIEIELQSGCGALFIMDIDDFKDINDCMGHSVGDSVLLRTAKRLKEFFGDDNIVGRLGGDEFIAYLKNENDVDILTSKAEELLSILCDRPENPDEPVVTISLGVAPVNEPCSDFSAVYSRADSALYEIKYGGKDSFKIFS